MAEDGGYIAIRGFAYQFDKSILEMLRDPAKVYQVEHLQDLNFENYAVQIKYYGTEYTRPQRKARIKNALEKLLKDFIKHPTQKYCLYAHFKGVDEAVQSLTINDLDDFLGKNHTKYEIQDKENFTEDLQLVYAPDFIVQFEAVLDEIKKAQGCDRDTALSYHALMFCHLERLVLAHQLDDADQRQCSGADLERLIRTSKEYIFRRTYAEFMGKQKHYKFLHKQHFNRRQISPRERFFLIETDTEDRTQDITEVLNVISEKWSKNGNRTPDRDRCAPYFHLVTPPECLVAIKSALIDDGKRFKDGYTFFGADFSPATLVARHSKGERYDMMFVNKEEQIAQALVAAGRPKEIYQFYRSVPIEIDADVKHVKVEIDTLADILAII